jgi:hypothetical protein
MYSLWPCLFNIYTQNKPSLLVKHGGMKFFEGYMAVHRVISEILTIDAGVR